MGFIHPHDADQQETVFVEDSFFQTTIFPKPEERCRKGESIGSYVKLVDRMARNNPNLHYLRHELMRAWPTKDSVRGRAAVLEFFEGRVTDHKFEDPQGLEYYLRSQHQGPLGRLFLLEDIATDYVEALGGHFRIDPAFFARHLRTVIWENSQQASSTPPLPSMSDGDLSFSISYPQVLKISGPDIQKISSLFCYSNVYRGIDAIRVNHWFDKMVYIRMMVSFWSRKHSNGYWDGESRSRSPRTNDAISMAWNHFLTH
jgi:hypothetical protein